MWHVSSFFGSCHLHIVVATYHNNAEQVGELQLVLNPQFFDHCNIVFPEHQDQAQLQLQLQPQLLVPPPPPQHLFVFDFDHTLFMTPDPDDYQTVFGQPWDPSSSSNHLPNGNQSQRQNTSQTTAWPNAPVSLHPDLCAVACKPGPALAKLFDAVATNGELLVVTLSCLVLLGRAIMVVDGKSCVV